MTEVCTSRLPASRLISRPEQLRDAVEALVGRAYAGTAAPPESRRPESRRPESRRAAWLDPALATTYEELLVAFRALPVYAGVTNLDIERITGGRLGRSTTAGILAGVQPACGVSLILLLRACGVRQDTDRWIAAWSRLRGSRLGNPLPARRKPAAPEWHIPRRLATAARQLAVWLRAAAGARPAPGPR